MRSSYPISIQNITRDARRWYNTRYENLLEKRVRIGYFFKVGYTAGEEQQAHSKKLKLGCPWCQNDGKNQHMVTYLVRAWRGI